MDEAAFNKDGAFYNPAMQFNRDLTIACINAFMKDHETKFKILEALGASGLRSVRFAKELTEGKVNEIICNDVSKNAVETIDKNIRDNGVENIVKSNLDDAVDLLQRNRISYDDRKRACLRIFWKKIMENRLLSSKDTA